MTHARIMPGKCPMISCKQGLRRASKTLNNVRGAWVEGQKVSCDASGHILEYRVILKVTFVLED